MIPHDAKPIGGPRVAELFGIALGTLRNSGRTREPGFPPQLNPGGKIGIWDERQVIAHRDGTEMPEVVTDDAQLEPAQLHPLDLLTDTEAAAAAGVASATWRKWASGKSEASTEAVSVEVCGQRHWLRGTILRRHEQPPGHGGRSVGDVDLKPRKRRGTASR